MPIRFYRRFRAGPFRMNVGKRGASYSVGTRGLWFTAGRRHIRTSIGLPSTGVYLYQQRRLRRPTSAPMPVNPKMERRSMFWRTLALIVVTVLTAWAIFSTH